MHSHNVQPEHKAVEVPRFAYRFRQAAQVIALLVAILGLVVLCGWAFNVPVLTYIRPTFQSMKVNTAFSFVCLGAGLWLAHNDQRQRSRRILGFFVVIIAGLTLAEYVFHVSLGIDQLLVRDTTTSSLSAYPGRMAIATAVCFLLFGLAVTLGVKKATALQHTFVAACFTLSVVAVCGYLYGAQSVYSITSFSTIGLHTSAGLFAACLAYFLGRPDEGIVSIAASDTSSGFLLRTLGPAIVVVPILIGWLSLAGQRANLYDTPFGIALLVLASIGCLTAVTFGIARSMHRLELEHSHAEKARFGCAAIVESSDDAIIGTDVSGTVTDWNKGAERLFGYSAKEAIGSHISFLSTADRLENGQNVLKRVLNGEVLRHYETLRQRNDGTHVEISLTASPIFDVEGRIVGAQGMVHDITQRKRAEEAASRHSAIVESSEDAIISKNLDGVITSWNPGAEHLFGYTEAEAVGQPITIIIPPELRDEENKILEKLRGGRVAHLETIRVTKAGARVDVSLSISPIKNSSGKVTGICKIARDITERKGAELALRETNLALEEQTAVLQSREELLKIFVKSVPAGVAMFDREMRYLQASDRWCADYGLDSSQVVGRSHYELFPDLPPRWKEIHHRALQGETLRAEEDRWDRADGGTRWIYWVVRPWLTVDGTAGGILIFAEDITRRKLMEEALSDMNRRLLNAQEQERVRIARELHDDVNQRLGLVTIQLDQMRTSSPTADWSSRLEQLAVMTRDISADVHSMAHHLHSSKLDFMGLVPAVREACREMSLGHEIDIDVEATDVAESLGRDITICVYRVIQEALQNVVRHSRAHEVRVSINQERNQLITTISDDGCGFDPDSLPPGKGLGLVTMRERLRLVHGKLRLESVPGAGSRIHITVPLEANAL